MGFADYTSRHPNSQLSGDNIDKNHVIKTIEAKHYTLNTTHRKLTNQIARKRSTLNDVINHSNLNKTQQSAFCHLHANKQLPSLTLNNSNNKNYSKIISIQIHLLQINYINPLIHILQINYLNLYPVDQIL